MIETRFNVVRSGLPHRVAIVRKLRDYLPPGDRDVPAAWAERLPHPPPADPHPTRRRRLSLRQDQAQDAVPEGRLGSRHPVLGGLLDGSVRFTWVRASEQGQVPEGATDAVLWEGGEEAPV